MHFDELNPEKNRLRRERWRHWGPYLSERQWGTVREDYSPDGSYWDYFTFDQAKSRAYRWGEDGIGGFSDNRQLLCLSVALWNHRDSILKERLFGLTNSEGNHGEDVKECYYYLEALPSHAYLKMLYKYPQRPFPYQELRRENKARSKRRREYELVDTGCFDDDRYFDVFIEYAKVTPDDVQLLITAHNRGPEDAPLDIIPQLYFRNTWSWRNEMPRPVLYVAGDRVVGARHLEMGEYFFHAPEAQGLLFCDNDTHPTRIHGLRDAPGYYKDAVHDYVVSGVTSAVNPQQTGTKVAAHHRFIVGPGGTAVVRCRLSNKRHENALHEFEQSFARRRDDTDAFYAEIQADVSDTSARDVQRQAFAGMIWNKQVYNYDLWDWLNGDPTQPPPPKKRLNGRNASWQHLVNADVISMPDKWEFPWYATWDLAFHCITFALIDPWFAKDQLILFTRERFMHPSGQLPAYEGHFSDVNPPVHAWATWQVFKIDRAMHGGVGDLPFLERVFHKLLLNFTWWVNRKDVEGLNIFQGGFLGLDNIGVFDRGQPTPTGGHIVQADGTSWMAMYSLDMLRIALELAKHNPVYEDIASKFFQHFLHIAKAMHNIGDLDAGLWDSNDQFYYDVIKTPHGEAYPLKARSVVGLIPLFAVETLEHDILDRMPNFNRRARRFLARRPDLEKRISQRILEEGGHIRLLAIMSADRIKSVLKYMLDEDEFFSPFGIRALSRRHLQAPFCLELEKDSLCVDYRPGESDSEIFGGNSNWRGPVWVPINFMIIESLREYHAFYGDAFRVECPTGSGRFMTLAEVADQIAARVCRIFLRDEQGRRSVFGDTEKYQTDPHFRDHLLFYEYFHGDTGRGCGASHQTGWTGLVANLISRGRHVNDAPLSTRVAPHAQA